MRIIEFDPSENDRVNAAINEFSLKRSGEGYYRTKRAAFKPMLDELRGKKGEFAVAKMAMVDGSTVEGPDLEVYGPNRKSWAPDLVIDGIPTHVKTCSLDVQRFAGTGNLSWTFQMQDHLFGDGHDDDMVALVVLKEWSDPVCVIRSVAPWSKVRDRLVDPTLLKYVGQKKCLTLSSGETISALSA